MRAFTNYNNVFAYSENIKLPAGAYKVKIMRAEEQDSANNSCALCILFDICEGEYQDFFMKKFQADKQANPQTVKYKGVFRLWYANGGQYDENNERKMKTALQNIADSNNLHVDFTKEWDGAVLKNCEVGMIFRDQEWEYNGYTGFTAQPYSIITLETLKEGKFTLPKPKYLNGNVPSASSAPFQEMPTDEDLPF